MLISGSKCSECDSYIEKVFLKFHFGKISRSRLGVMGTDFRNETFPHLYKPANHFQKRISKCTTATL